MTRDPFALRRHCVISSIICSFGIGFTISANAQEAGRDTLRVDASLAIARALDVSPEVNERMAQRDFATARYDFARASRFLSEFKLQTAHSTAPGLDNPNGTPTDRLYLDPDVRNEFDKLRIFNRAEASLVQPVYTWGELGGSISAARHAVDVEEASAKAKASEVALRTGQLYYDLLLAESLNRLTTEAGDIVERAKTEIQRLLGEGASDVDDADLFQVLITEQEFNRRVVEVTQKLATARVALTRQLLLPTDVFVDGGQELEPLTVAIEPMATYERIALIERPELSQARAGLSARSSLVRAERSNYYPKLFLGASFSVSGAPGRYRQPNPYHSDRLRGQSLEAGFGFRQNLNVAQTRARVRQAEAERNKVVFQLEAAEQLILFEVEAAYRNVEVARAALEAQQNALQLSKDWLRSEEINFDLDLGDTENLVKAVQANLSLQASEHQAVRDLNVAILRLLQASGLLVASVKNGTLVDQSPGN